MFSNTRNKVTSTSYTENGGEFPFISNIDYLKGSNDLKLSNSSIYYLNEKHNYYIKISFNKELIVSENTRVRILFNNNTYIEREVESGEVNYLLIEGDNTIHYENALKVIDIEIINGYIKDEFNHELNTKVKEEIINKQPNLYILNQKPVVSASSEKEFYTTNIASIIIDANKEFISSYCISETNTCIEENFVAYTTNQINYEFVADESNEKLCVFVKDKAGNISDCSTVSFNYYSSPKINFDIEEGNTINSNVINIDVDVEKNEHINLIKYCVVIDDSECITKEIKEKIKEKIILSNSEGEKTVKFILFDDKENKFEYVKKVILDTSNPKLEFKITNSDIVSNYKDILINYTDNNSLDENNKYEYYLSSSEVVLTGGSWIKFENNKPFRIRKVNDGDYYLWIRNISDLAGNRYSNDDYILISEKLSFDNSKPFINIINSNESVNESNLTKEFIITYDDNNEIKETILDSSSLVVNCTCDSKYSVNIKEIISNGWVVEISFEKETLVNGHFSLTVLSNLIEDIAGNRNDEITSDLIKIN